jgi:dTMP kinase
MLPNTPIAHAPSAPVALTARRVKTVLQRREHTRGLLIALEGPDGSGKSTQQRLLEAWLRSEGHQVVSTRWNSSKLVKPLVKARKAIHALSPVEYSLFHAADFRQRLDREILPALWAGRTVLADRYVFTALARDVARGLDARWVQSLYSPIFWPDLVLYFSVSPGTSAARVLADRAPSFYEAGQDVTGIDDPGESYRQFIGTIIGEYDHLATVFDFATLDAEGPIYDVHQRIRALLREGARRPWHERNMEALREWLSEHPEEGGQHVH